MDTAGRDREGTGNQKSSCRSETIFANFHWKNKFPEWLEPEMLGTCLQAVTDSSFSLFAYWQRGRESWIFGKLILRDSSILNPPRDTLFLWLVWRRHWKFTKKKQAKLRLVAGGKIEGSSGRDNGRRIQDIRDVNVQLRSQFGSKVCHRNQTFTFKSGFYFGKSKAGSLTIQDIYQEDLIYRLGSGLKQGHWSRGGRRKRKNFWEKFKSVFFLRV